MTKLPVLDQGYVELIENWGSDEAIIEAARMSTGKGFQGWGPKVQCEYCGAEEKEKFDPSSECSATGVSHSMGPYGPPGDEKLLKFLYDNRHMTPFEMAGMIIEVKAPIFVFREWHRHRTQSYNEMSARYIPLPDDNYMPTMSRMQMVGGSNKQAQGSQSVSTNDAYLFAHKLGELYQQAQAVYEFGLSIGIPKELARLPVPVARYSKMRAAANLRNWLAFLTLRMAPNAQWEIRQYANAVGELIAQQFPRTWELFVGEKESAK